MLVDTARFAALVERQLATPDPAPAAGAAPAPSDEAAQAARQLGALVHHAGLLIEVAADDVRAWLADWQDPRMDVRVFEAVETRAVGVTYALGDWLRRVRAVVIEVAGGPDLTLHEVSGLAEALYAWLPEEVDVVFGASVDDALQGRVGLRLVALGAAS